MQMYRNKDKGSELPDFQDIVVTVAATAQGHAKTQQVVKQYQEVMWREGEGWARLADAIDCILAGERDEDELCCGLGNEKFIVSAILQALE